MIVSDVHQIKSLQTFNSLISFFVEDELFSTDELQDEIVNEEENHSMNYKPGDDEEECFTLNWVVISQV